MSVLGVESELKAPGQRWESRGWGLGLGGGAVGAVFQQKQRTKETLNPAAEH